MMTNQTVAPNGAEKPLTGVRILDMTHAYSGPFCTMHLADQGAEVIKLEVPGKGDQSRNWAPFKNGSSGYFAYINRNKKGLSLDLKSPEGKEIFKKLVAECDVLCENFRVGTMEKLGLGYDVLKEINPSPPWNRHRQAGPPALFAGACRGGEFLRKEHRPDLQPCRG